MDEAENALRQRLSIPNDAQVVLVFGETSHWDPNWLLTSEEYYVRLVRHILDDALSALSEEPRRVYSIEGLFFLKLYWERNPAQRETIRRLINEGRLRLTGTGITTPDTLLPETEAILRDYLFGQEWLRENGMEVEPRIAYLPDDFGHSPALPSMLVALGFDYAAITRIDGMYFVGTDYRRKGSFPLPGSSAHRLLELERSLDFVWRGPDNNEVLCHWNAFTYFQGDMLAHMGIIRWMDLPLCLPWRTGRHVARRIDGFVRQLQPLSRTPYLFCPIGCDFTGPLKSLLPLLERYNTTRYPETGVFLVNAGLDDYLDLVACHRESLPTLSLDPNPYWMGFYGTRPAVKQRVNRISHKLGLTEMLVAASEPKAEATNSSALKEAWDLLVVSNHHDFITGTAPDSVWVEEQRPWLEHAESLADDALTRARARAAPRTSLSASDGASPPAWRLDDGDLEVVTRHNRLVLSGRDGGCIVTLEHNGTSLIDGPANDLVVYRDSGGLWRMGHEYLGGTFRELERASAIPATIRATERLGTLEVKVEVELAGRRFVRQLWLRDDSPVIRMRLVGAAPARTTVTCRFPTVLRTEQLLMDVPGGLVRRPRHKLYTPTFWPARSFVHAVDPVSGRGLAAFLGGPAAPSLGPDGAMEWMALRNAPRERAFVILPLLAHPASGTDPDEHAFDYAVMCTSGGWQQEHTLPRIARQVLGEALLPDAPDIDSVTPVRVDHDGVLVAAVKPASRGQGWIVRLHCFAYPDPPRAVQLTDTRGPIRAAWLCDARERDRRPLAVRDGGATVPIEGAITSVRLLV